MATMNAVILKGPKHVAVERRPVPTLQGPKDVIVRVQFTALCGSELHVYRGHQPSPTGFIMGHEFTGFVEEVGDQVKSFKKGDKVVSPFTTSCGECFYCKGGFSSRCSQSKLFGCATLDGGQAEFVRVVDAESTLFHAPLQVPDSVLVLMADIFPTGYFGAKNAFKEFTPEQAAEATVVMIGCGPVGLCSLVNILDYKPKHLFAVDAVESRLEQARLLGAEPLNFQKDYEGMKKRILEVTDGRGADIAIEIVGLSPALRTAFDLIRPWGVISSIGVHNKEIPWTAKEAYDKNLRLQQGRCPVRSIFPEALTKLEQKHHLLGFMADKVMPLTQAVEGYEIFDSMKVQKVVFTAHN